MNIYIVADPASSKKRQHNDYTSIGVIGLGPDDNYYLLDGVRDRLNLSERWGALLYFHKKYHPKRVAYEEAGMQADIEHFKSEMKRENYHFEIVALNQTVPKLERIRGMIPIFEQGRFFFPDTMYYTDYQGKTQDLISVFIHEEYKPFPVSVHDDFFDMMSMIRHPKLEAVWPKGAYDKQKGSERYDTSKQRRQVGSWMSR